MITVWRDFDHCRNPKRFRSDNHKRKLSELICHLHKQNYFRSPHLVVTLSEWDLSAEAIELWARARELIARYEGRPRSSAKAMPPLFLLADELDQIIPSRNNLIAARRDLDAAVGARAALSRNGSEKDLLFV
jgi:hypothetical protein